MALSLFIGALLIIQGVNSMHSCSLLEKTWDLVEEGGVPPFALLLKQEILKEGDTLHALGSTVTAVSELAWPRPASGCGHSKLINANVALKEGTNVKGQVCNAIESYAVVLAQAVDNLRLLGLCCVMPSPWPVLENSCGDYGRVYQFEENLDIAGCKVSEGVRCAARRLYLAPFSRANNVGAAASSAATEPAIYMMSLIEPQLKDFLEAVTEPQSGPCDVRSQNRRLKSLAGALKRDIFAASDSAMKKYGHH